MAIQNNFPSIRPSLALDFANTKTLDPRITFTRASTATYYDGKTVAKAEENLITQSETNSLSSGGTTNNGDGTYTLAAATHWVFRTRSAETLIGTQFTVSVTLSGTGVVRLTGLSGTGGAMGSDVEVTLTATPTRYSWTGTNSGTGVNCGPLVRGAADNSPATVRTEKWQMELRGQATAYTPTTTQPITNYIPVLLTAPANVARFDHNPVTGESLGLLIEEQRTNLLLRSQEFDDASWGKFNAAITANTVVAPDGTLTADRFVANTTAGVEHYAEQTIATVTNQAYTQSVYIKLDPSVAFCTLTTVAVGSTSNVSYWNLQNTGGVVSSVNFTGLISSVSLTSIGNGWYRAAWTYTLNGTVTSHRARIYPISFSGGVTVGAGDGFSGIYIWGAQLEAGAFPTSYIPTVAAQATRQADAASMTGVNFSSWFSQAAGSFYAEWRGGLESATSGFGRVLSYDGSRTFLNADGVNGSNRIGSWNNSVNLVLTMGVSPVTNFVRAAMAFSGAPERVLVSGAAVSTSATSLGVAPTTLGIGSIVGSSSPLNGHIRKIAYYPARLSNAALQAITS